MRLLFSQVIITKKALEEWNALDKPLRSAVTKRLTQLASGRWSQRVKTARHTSAGTTLLKVGFSKRKGGGRILFEKLGLQPVKKTKTGPSTDADSLQKMIDEHPIVEDLLRYREVEKLLFQAGYFLPSYCLQEILGLILMHSLNNLMILLGDYPQYFVPGCETAIPLLPQTHQELILDIQHT